MSIDVIVREIDGTEWVPASTMQKLIDSNEQIRERLERAIRLIEEVAEQTTPFTVKLYGTAWGMAAEQFLKDVGP